MKPSKLGVIFLFSVCVVRSYGALEGKTTLRIASDLRHIFLMKMSENDRFDRYKGFVKDFSEELMSILGYQYELVIPPDFHSQSLTNRANSTISGYWNGVFGMLVRNEVDLAFGDTEITMERAQVVDFSAPVLTTRFAVLHKIQNATFDENASESNQWTVLEPFPVAVWVPFAILAVVYFGFIKVHGLRSNLSRFIPDVELRYSKKLTLLFFGTWALLLLTSYISNYTALKVIQSTKRENMYVQSVIDIASKKNVKIGWVARGPVERFFRNTVSELYQKIYIQNIGRDWLSSEREGINKVINENGNYAFVMDSLMADLEVQLDCSLYKLPQEFGPIRSISVATPIGSSLRERINQAVLSLSEQGIIEALQRRWFTHTTVHCSATSEKRTNSAKENASIQEMSVVFILAIVGLLLATIVGLVEMHLVKRKSKSATVSIPVKSKSPRLQQQQQTELLPKFSLEDV